MFSFTPNRLIQARAKIEKIHKNQGTINYFGKNEELEQLIESIICTDDKHLKTKALTLSRHEINMVAAYLPYNYYSINMDPLFVVFKFCINREICEILYDQWQESFANPLCNQFISKLIDSEKIFIKALEKSSVNIQNFKKIISSESVIVGYSKLIAGTIWDSKLSLENRLSSIGIRNGSRLSLELKRLYYTFCSKEDYLQIESEKLLEYVKQYVLNTTLHDFVINFISKLKINDLLKFSNIAQHLENRLGDCNEKKCIDFFEKDSPQLYIKFRNWINSCNVNRLFGNDERSKFWKNFSFISVKKSYYSNSIIMECEDFIITEFLGKANGPMYFFEKNEFQKNFSDLFRRNTNEIIRQELYKIWKSQKANNADKRIQHRIEHMPSWTQVASRYLIENRITEYIN